MKQKPITQQEVQALYEMVRQLEKALDAKHKQFVEQRAKADHFEMKYECKKPHECVEEYTVFDKA